MKIRKPKVAYIPFSYPDYPKEIVYRLLENSQKMLREIELDLIEADPVITFRDVDAALSILRKEEIDLIIANLISWIEAPNLIAVLKDFKQKPLILWSHTMFREAGELLTLGPLPATGVIRETLEEMGFRFWFIWGMPEEEKVRAKISLYSRVARALNMLSKSRIGLLGYASMGMYTGTFDHLTLRDKIGTEVDQVDQYVLLHLAEKVKDE